MCIAIGGTCAQGAMPSHQCLNLLKRVKRPSGRDDKLIVGSGAPPDWPGSHPSPPPEWSNLGLLRAFLQELSKVIVHGSNEEPRWHLRSVSHSGHTHLLPFV